MSDCGERNKIVEMDERLRSVEQAICSIGETHRYMKYAVLILAATLGFDMSAVML